jgi:hypothetical protein
MGISNSIVQQKRSSIVVDGIVVRVRITNMQISEHLKTSIWGIFCLPKSRSFSSAAEMSIHDVLGFKVFSFEQQFTDFGKVANSLGVQCFRIFASRPHGDIVQNDMFCIDTPIGHHADASVPKRKSSFPNCGRRSILQYETVFRSFRCANRKGEQNEKKTVKIVLHINIPLHWTKPDMLWNPRY